MFNEKNNGESILNLINNNLVESVHDISSGGLITAVAEMSMHSGIGVKLEKPKKLSNIIEYLFGEDQGRYILEIEKSKLLKAEKLMKDNNVFFEMIGKTQNDLFELSGEFAINVKELSNINNQWYNNY